MITGANTGIGKATAMEFAKRGGTVHMLCLFSDEDARKEIVEKSGNKNVYLHELDLSVPKNIYQFAKQFTDSHDSLDVLVNNAGCMIRGERKLTADGLEMTFAVNNLAPYILTTMLIPLLNKTPGSRVIVVVSSGMYYFPKTDVSDLQNERLEPYNGLIIYGKCKRQLATVAEMWAQTFPKIHFSAMHPGLVNTGMVQTAMPDLCEQTKTSSFRTPEQGADTVVWLGISQSALNQASGRVYLDRKVTHTHLPGRDTNYSTDERLKLMENLETIATNMKGTTH